MDGFKERFLLLEVFSFCIRIREFGLCSNDHLEFMGSIRILFYLFIYLFIYLFFVWEINWGKVLTR